MKLKEIILTILIDLLIIIFTVFLNKSLVIPLLSYHIILSEKSILTELIFIIVIYIYSYVISNFLFFNPFEEDPKEKQFSVKKKLIDLTIFKILIFYFVCIFFFLMMLSPLFIMKLSTHTSVLTVISGVGFGFFSGRNFKFWKKINTGSDEYPENNYPSLFFIPIFVFIIISFYLPEKYFYKHFYINYFILILLFFIVSGAVISFLFYKILLFFIKKFNKSCNYLYDQFIYNILPFLTIIFVLFIENLLKVTGTAFLNSSISKFFFYLCFGIIPMRLIILFRTGLKNYVNLFFGILSLSLFFYYNVIK